MKPVKISKGVLRRMALLEHLLYINGYFSFFDTAEDYINQIIDYFEKNIPYCPNFASPHYFNKYGKNLKYIMYRYSKQTTWYAFFEEKEDKYVIRYITNNHLDGHHIL